MKKIAFIFFIQFSLSSFCQTKQVCFTFDDLPVVSYGITDTNFQKDIINKLILSLVKNKIPAIGFVNEKKLFLDDSLVFFQERLLKNWDDNGLEIGNHTFSHFDYNNVSFEDYTQDLLRGEIITNEILSLKNKKVRYFRHPYLHVGNTKEKADSLSNFLINHGYIAAPVTIDNDDYLFAKAYQVAKVKNDTTLFLKIGNDYIAYMESKLKYYEKQANILYNREIKQVLLLHASLINADYMDSLIEMFRNNDYSFISMDKALADEVYKSEINFFGNRGLSWIDKWALSQGKKEDFFKDEPDTPDYIKELSK